MMAERIVDKCEEQLGGKRSACVTADEALPGGDVEADLGPVEAELKARGFDDAAANRAARLYGGEAKEVFAKVIGVEAEVEFAVTHEGALTLEDYWVRRSARARFAADGGVSILEPASEWMGALLGWSAAERARQVEACLAKRAREMAFREEG